MSDEFGVKKYRLENKKVRRIHQDLMILQTRDSKELKKRYRWTTKTTRNGD